MLNNKNAFLEDLKKLYFGLKTDDPNENYTFSTNAFF